MALSLGAFHVKARQRYILAQTQHQLLTLRRVIADTLKFLSLLLPIAGRTLSESISARFCLLPKQHTKQESITVQPCRLALSSSRQCTDGEKVMARAGTTTPASTLMAAQGTRASSRIPTSGPQWATGKTSRHPSQLGSNCLRSRSCLQTSWPSTTKRAKERRKAQQEATKKNLRSQAGECVLSAP